MDTQNLNIETVSVVIKNWLKKQQPENQMKKERDA